MEPDSDRTRIDKWLWAARFFKTRSLAAKAVEGGKVRLNEERVKPAKELRIGDRLRIRVGEQEWSISVRSLETQRRGAPQAQLLYEEEAASIAAREAARAAREGWAEPMKRAGRPTKRDRRMIKRFNED